MKKRMVSLLCTALLVISLIPPANALEGEGSRAADTLYTLGLLTTDTYTLDLPADQAVAAVLLVRLAGAEAETESCPPLSGAPEWASKSSSYAVQKGWISVREFGSGEPLTANGWFGMLLRMLGYGEEDFAESDAALFARRVGLASRPYGETLKRGALFESAVDALRFPYRDGSGTILDRLVEREICSQAVVNALGLTNRELTARQTADRYMSAVFCLDLYASEDDYEIKNLSFSASGFFISPDGLAVTNYHAIEGAVRGLAILVTGEVYEVERVLWYNVDMDLAVIRISQTSASKKTATVFSYLDIAGSAEVRPSDAVYTLGNPLGLGLAVSSGIVSAVNRDTDRWSTVPCIMNTADISFGSSGGALLNIYGRVLAVTSGAFRGGNNMYLAVPVDLIPELDPETEGQTLQEVEDDRLAQIEADDVE